ncbi:hypothetical protein IA69_26220 [Massilia sp. JS1662]|nr:S8 family serine peptidase [Massilia sp. JS1662]KGF79128.1 hypothetical protein IA69_26220 [Massilia sp. JS1662]
MQPLDPGFLSSRAICVRAIAVLFLTLGLAGCGGGEQGASASQSRTAAQVTAAAVAQDVSILSLSKLSETRVSRTVYDYVFRITVVNSGAAKTGVVAKLTAVGTGTSIVDGDVNVGNILAGATLTPTDTITLRHDRTYPFSPAALVWSITTTVTPPSVVGILIPGPANARAVDMLTDYVAPRTPADLTLKREGGNSYYANILHAMVHPTATVASVNAALNASGARLAFSMSGSDVVSLQVPDTANLAALRALADSLVDSGAFVVAAPSMRVASKKLFGSTTPAYALSPAGPYFHHVASRVVQAWNMLNAEKMQPDGVELILIDHSAPDKNGDEHLYAVASAWFAKFTSSQNPLGVLQLDKQPIHHIIDLDVKQTPLEASMDDIEYISTKLRAIFTVRPAKKYVINLSVGYEDPSTFPLSEVQEHAILWRERVRNLFPTGYKYEDQVLQVSAAGNENKYDAKIASLFNASGKLGTLTDAGGKAHAPLSNTLVVEARSASFPQGDVTQAGCLWALSNVGGDIGAVGDQIALYNSRQGTAKYMSGTSFATPQVAGLAAWMLAIRPTLSIADLRGKILGTSRVDSCTGAKPMMDAFAALLSLDNSMADAPVRLALLQPSTQTPALRFGTTDAFAFLNAYFPEAYPVPPALPQPDLSRFDLNGDGFTGDRTRRVAFDLKFDGKSGIFVPVAITEYESPAGTPITGLNENGVTDFEVLCYYVNSPLFDQSQKQAFDRELERISAVPAIGRKISCSDRVVVLNVNATQPGWTGLPAQIRLSNFVPRFPATPAGNSATCTNQGEPPGERGTPLFSGQVPSPLPISAAIDVVGVPSQIGREPNRRNCSSFYASAGSQVWINATGRTVFGFGGAVVSDWEFQVRYSNGAPNGAGKQCTIGVVPGSGVWLPAFSDPTCTHRETAMVAQ